MAAWKINLVIVLIMFYAKMSQPSPYRCADSQKALFKEGNFGQKEMFPWLGVLRVHLHEGEKTNIAVTGVILVKEKYAIANAHDIVKIPQRIFKSDSLVMFIKENNDAWTCRPKDYMTHPEYEFATVNTIAIIELEHNEYQPIPIIPACWPPYRYNASNHIYALGFTDENQLLEKIGYKMQYVGRRECDEFYNRSGFSDEKTMPTHFQCVFSPTNKKDCVFENGMAFASNATGPWFLIGIGIRGPGCAAPARFIDLNYYLPWVESSTKLEDGDVLRRSAFNEGFKSETKTNGIKDIPMHTLLRSEPGQSDQMNYHEYRHDFFYVDRFEPDAISVSFDTLYEKKEKDCHQFKKIVYNENMKIVTNTILTASYKVSLADIYFADYNCVVIKVESANRSPAYIWYTLEIDDFSVLVPKTPKEIIKVTKHREEPIREKSKNKNEKPKWKPHEDLEVGYLEERLHYRPYNSVHIILKIQVKGTGTLSLAVYGPVANPDDKPTTRMPTVLRKKGLQPKVIKKESRHNLTVLPINSENNAPNMTSRGDFSNGINNVIHIIISRIILCIFLLDR